MTFRWNRNDLLGSSPWHSRAQEPVRDRAGDRVGIGADAVAVESAAIKVEHALRALPADVRHSIAETICDEEDRPAFDLGAGITLLAAIFCALWMGRTHLVGHQAGVMSGALLAIGLMSAWQVVVSAVDVVRHRRSHQGAA